MALTYGLTLTNTEKAPNMTPQRKAKLTKAYVEGISFEQPNPDKPIASYFIRDMETQGFALRITSNNMKTFYAERTLNNKRCLVHCGQFPETTTAQARDLAKVALEQIRIGINPNHIVKEQKFATAAKQDALDNTLGEAFTRYKKQHGLDSDLPLGTKYSPTQRDLIMCEKHLEHTVLWKTPFHLINIEIIDQAFTALKAKVIKNNKSKNVTGVATVNKFYRYCCAAYNKEANRLDYAGINQFTKWLKDAKPEKTSRRSRELPMESKSGKLWLQTVAKLRNNKAFSKRVMADYILLTLLWGTRRGEANLLEMENVFFDTESVVFRDTKNGKDHWLPVGKHVMAILKNRIEENEKYFQKKPARRSQWLFPSRERGKHITSPNKVLDDINREAGIEIDLHDLRRTFVGIALSTTKDSLLTKLSVNHSSGTSDITASYFSVQAKLKTLRPYFEQWEQKLLGLAGIIEPEPESDKLKEMMETLKKDPALLAVLKAQLGEGTLSP